MSASPATWGDILEACRCDFAEQAVIRWSPSFIRSATLMQIRPAEVMRQARLHLPCCSIDEVMSASEPPAHLLSAVSSGIALMATGLTDYVVASAADRLCRSHDGLVITVDLRVTDKFVDFGRLSFESVDAGTARKIEGQLHYLQAYREDACF